MSRERYRGERERQSLKEMRRKRIQKKDHLNSFLLTEIVFELICMNICNHFRQDGSS